MQTIHSFTETLTDYPGYVVINEANERISVSVRSRGTTNVGWIVMDRDQLETMARDILTYLGVDHMPVLVFDPNVGEPVVTPSKDKA